MISDLRAQIGPLLKELDDIQRARTAVTSPPPIQANPLRVEVIRELTEADRLRIMTLKQLVVKALAEAFPGGATALQLLAHFKAWGRDIARTSLSPQLSRLKDEGVIERSGKVWTLATAKDQSAQNAFVLQ